MAGHRGSPQKPCRVSRKQRWVCYGFASALASVTHLQTPGLVRGACEAVPEPPDVFVFCFQEFSATGRFDVVRDFVPKSCQVALKELSATNVVLLTSGDEVRQALARVI